MAEALALIEMTDTVIAVTTTAMIIAIGDDWAHLGHPDAHEGILMAGIVTHAATSMVITTTMVASAIIAREIVTVIVIATEREKEIETAIVIEEVQGEKTAPKGERNGAKLSVRLALEVQQWVFWASLLKPHHDLGGLVPLHRLYSLFPFFFFFFFF
jgi:hypothetical protein